MINYKVLAAEPRSKKRSGDEAFGISRKSLSTSTQPPATQPILEIFILSTRSFLFLVQEIFFGSPILSNRLHYFSANAS